MLSPNYVLLQGTTPHDHEREAIEFVKKELPDKCTFPIWSLCDLVDVSGRRYEIDLLLAGTRTRGYSVKFTGEERA